MKKKFLILFLILLISMYIGAKWESLPFIKNSVGSVLDPSLGKILEWNLILGFIIIVFIISIIVSLIQKFTTNQEELKELKKEQKYFQEEMKKYRDNPEKVLEIYKKQGELLPKTMNLTLNPILYTAIPMLLLFRWFADKLMPSFGNWWILYYIILSIIFSTIIKKIFKIA